MNLWAISDLHVGYEDNRRAVESLEALPDDWLIIAGDTGETPAHLDFVLKSLVPRFAQIIWTVGNHDLWTPQSLPQERRGVAHYERLVRLCRSYGVLTPEDSFAVWPGAGPRTAIVPTFGLYDYSFRPGAVSEERAVAWAAEAGVRCADEDLLDPSPFRSRQQWCAARVAYTEQRLEVIPKDTRVILVNHWPLLIRAWRPAAHSALFDLVRHRGDLALASPVSRGHRGVRPPASAQHAGARWRDLRRSVARLPEAVEQQAAAPRVPAQNPIAVQTFRNRSAAPRSVSSFLAKQKRSTGPPPSLYKKAEQGIDATPWSVMSRMAISLSVSPAIEE